MIIVRIFFLTCGNFDWFNAIFDLASFWYQIFFKKCSKSKTASFYTLYIFKWEEENAIVKSWSEILWTLKQHAKELSQHKWYDKNEAKKIQKQLKRTIKSFEAVSRENYSNRHIMAEHAPQCPRVKCGLNVTFYYSSME